MRRLLILIAIGLLVFAAIYRQRIYLWDPLATVTRDGVKQDSVRVMINYANDVLMDDNSTQKRRLYLVQNWNKIAEFSTGPLNCVEYLACMADEDGASGKKIVPGKRGRRQAFAGVTMTDKRVEFVDETGALVVVALR